MRSSNLLSVYIEIDLTNLAAVQPFTRRQREDDTSVVDRGLVFRIQLQNFSFLPLPPGHNWYLLSPIGSLFTAIESTPSVSDENLGQLGCNSVAGSGSDERVDTRTL